MVRRKLENKKIENLKYRRVCFTKRRQGINKKAATLSKLSGIDTIFLTFSSTGRPYLSSTLPSSSAIDSIFDKIINDFQQSDQIAETPSSSSSSSLLQSQLNVENYNQSLSSVNHLFMGVDDVANLSLSQLQSYKHSLEQLKSGVSSTLENKASQENGKGGGSSISVGTGLPMLIDTDTTTDRTTMIPMVFTDDKLHNKDPTTDQVCEVGDEIDQRRRISSDDDLFGGNIDLTNSSNHQVYESDNEFDLLNFVGDLLKKDDALDQTYVDYNNGIDQMIEVYSNHQGGNIQFDGILSLWDD